MDKSSKNILFFFLLGLVAGLAALSVSIMLREFSGGLFLPEIGSELLFSLTPGEFESQAIEALGPLAKYSAFIGSIIVILIIFGIIGIFLIKLFMKFEIKKYVLKFLISFSTTFVFFVIVSVIIELVIQSRSGAQIIPIQSIVLSISLPQVAFALIFSLFGKEKKQKDQEILIQPPKKQETQAVYSRQEFLKLIGISAISLPIIFLGLNRLFSITEEIQQQTPSETLDLLPKSRSIPQEFQDPKLEPLLGSELTPTYLFYRIDINPIVPKVNVNSWSLKLKGNVENPLELKYDEIKSMPAIEEYVTLACISNKIGGDLIGTALWKGVRLKDILEKAKMDPKVKYIVFRCADGYDVGIPLERGLLDSTILAYEMNRAPLNDKHGFPVRAIVPGLYGMMNPKWITEIELVDEVYEGYWQRNGWDNVAEYNTGSSIVIPGTAPIRNRFRGLNEVPSPTPDELMPIAGIAFGGDRGISKVEVSIDGGETWKSAQIKDPLSKYTWVLWTGGFTPSGVENYKILVRATDKLGVTQTSEMNKPFPDGVTGYHSINV